MIYPTIAELTKDEFNRYELALATAKCARKLTDEYVTQREAAEKLATENKEAARSAINALNKEYNRDEKAVKTAINRIYKGEYNLIRIDPNAVSEETAEEAEAEADTEAEATPEEK